MSERTVLSDFTSTASSYSPPLTVPPSISLPPSMALGDVEALVFRPASMSRERTSRRPISNSSRQLIIAIFRTFPGMMTQSSTSLPPFVHALGWNLHYITEEAWQANASKPPMLDSLKPLAICSSLAQVFVKRDPESFVFQWQTIEAEQRRMDLDVGAPQAMLVQ